MDNQPQGARTDLWIESDVDGVCSCCSFPIYRVVGMIDGISYESGAFFLIEDAEEELDRLVKLYNV